MNKVFFKLFIHGRGLPMVLRGAGMLRCPVRAFLRSALPCLTQRHAFSCCCFCACLFWPVCGGQLLTGRRVGHGAEIATDPRLHRQPHPALTRAPSAVLAHAIPASSTSLSPRQLFSRSLLVAPLRVLLCACLLRVLAARACCLTCCRQLSHVRARTRATVGDALCPCCVRHSGALVRHLPPHAPCEATRP
jgi:hypothetical protein